MCMMNRENKTRTWIIIEKIPLEIIGSCLIIDPKTLKRSKNNFVEHANGCFKNLMESGIRWDRHETTKR